MSASVAKARSVVDVGRDDSLLHARQHVLAVDQKIRDHPRHQAAVVEDRFGQRAHQAELANSGTRPRRHRRHTGRKNDQRLSQRIEHRVDVQQPLNVCAAEIEKSTHRGHDNGVTTLFPG